MAVTETLYCTNTGDKLWNDSGQFTSTTRDSLSRGAVESSPQGISWDGTNTVWCGSSGDKLYLDSGKFAGTLKTSVSVSAIDTTPGGVGSDGTNTPWTGYTADKLYLTSGQFTSTLKTSRTATANTRGVDAVSISGSIHTVWSFDASGSNKSMYESGQFSATIRSSAQFNSVDTGIRSTTYDGVNSPWCGVQADKNYLASGLITTTLKTSLATGALSPTGTSHDDYASRMEISAGLDLTLDDPGILSLTGLQADTDHTTNLDLTLDSPGLLSVIGLAADYTATENVNFELDTSGILALTGQTADQVISDNIFYELDTPGVISLTGLAADYVQTTNIDLTLDDPGILDFTGLTADYEQTTNIDLTLDDAGILALTGDIPDVQITAELLDLTLDDPGILIFIGLQAEVDIIAPLELTLDNPGELVLAGITSDIVISQQLAFEALAGSLVLYGQKANVVLPSPAIAKAAPSGIKGKQKRSHYPRRIKLGDQWGYARSFEEERSLVKAYYDSLQRETELEEKISEVSNKKMKKVKLQLDELETKYKALKKEKLIEEQNTILLSELWQ